MQCFPSCAGSDKIQWRNQPPPVVARQPGHPKTKHLFGPSVDMFVSLFLVFLFHDTFASLFLVLLFHVSNLTISCSLLHKIFNCNIFYAGIVM